MGTRNRIYIHTWGCQMNEHKSEGIAGLLVREGFEVAQRPEDADVVIFNTCMVREKAEDKVYSEAGLIRGLKETKPELLLGIGGCMAQALGKKIFKHSPAVDFIFGSSNISDIPELIREAQRRNGQRNGSSVMAVSTIPDRIEELPFVRRSSFQAKVTITEGCSNFCSFCIVPYTTGLLRSRLPGDILREVTQLVDQGYKEVQLLGQNVDSYGNDLDDPDIDFANLLRALTRIEIPRIRFTSSHPKDITSGVIEVLSEENNVCEHVHMAVQSGSDRVLREMRRGYTREEFLELVHQLKSRVPGINITTDIIVGFPTETESDFFETADLVEKARFGGAFIFKYSPRPGTISYYKHPDTVPLEEKQRRLEHLLHVQKRITDEENRAWVRRTVEILVEGRARTSLGRYLGKTRDSKTVLFPGRPEMIGTFAKVAVEDAGASGLFGRVVS
ncbi:MAG: tRNA (N6-isopentenyl adenosine(37)-C2)-methylthiotransferase MiaB [Candidatus Fraserbacteria bacterium RBG_16_55_9]|uniref:tRNA-2-methylthio-N(6)-dimethylallyladenosine synthase n=1 Tax=Fraserbacteria sp. (strain RBG_16_55_9) TaxID=1817864 RepID=A0A1F5URC8_FRAXR|nr:MAG: tRNA (N6-isopentenyl adenosine(37)-C2)-methylthiotransferase MiaB [Candidatus Fraserbacteria bacterium RBG_16_55_9]